MSTGISSPLALSGLFASVDGRYVAANGKPFTSVNIAESELNGYPSKLSESCIGLTVLVKESGWTEAKEYWVQPKGTTPETYGLVEKGAGVTDYNNLDNKPTIGDGVNTALPIVGNVKVSATTASGETAGVNVIPGLNAGEIEMQFTLPKGADGADGQDGQDGAPGADAVNPFKGYYPSGVSKPATGAVGDYLYAPPSDQTSSATATIWHYDSTQTPPWTDTSIDVSNVVAVEFGSGQSVPATKIMDENGDEYAGAEGVLSAEAGKMLKEKSYGIDEETSGEEIVDETNYPGIFIMQETKTWMGGTGVGNRRSRKIDIPDGTSVLRFTIQTGYSRMALYTFTKKIMPLSNISFEQLISNGYLCDDVASYTDILKGNYSSGETVELQVPTGAKHLYFVRVDSEGNNHPVPLSVTPVIVNHTDGDIDLLKKSVEVLTQGLSNTEEISDIVDIPFSKENLNYTIETGHRVNGTTGEIAENTPYFVVKVSLGMAKKVQFRGMYLKRYTYVSGYLFRNELEEVLKFERYDVNLNSDAPTFTDYVVDVPSGATELVFTLPNESEVSVVSLNGETLTEYVMSVNDNATFEKRIDEIQQSFVVSNLSLGVITPDNTTVASNSKRHTPIIDVQEGDIIHGYFYYMNNSDEIKYSNTKIIQSVCCFLDGVNVPYGYYNNSASSPDTTLQYTYKVPIGCNGVIISFMTSPGGYGNIKLIIERKGEIVAYPKLSNNDNYSQRINIPVMEEGVSYGLPYTDVWSNKIMSFSAKVSRDEENGIGTLRIGGLSTTPYVTIDDTNISTKSWVSSDYNQEFAHGLTIDNDLQVIVEIDRSQNCLKKITLRSNGNEFLLTDSNLNKQWGQKAGVFGVKATVGNVFTDVSFSNALLNILSPVWVFGDSYLSYSSPRWSYWIGQMGITNFLVSSYAGENSKTAISSFQNLIALQKPKIVVWLLGMNDADSTGTTQSLTPNENWKECVEEVLSTCDRYGIIPILATIPSVKNGSTIYSNKAKNTWVRNSGRRFFDQEAAVGATEDGVWIDGYKEDGTGVHPSTKGAKALATRFLADVPEIAF